MIARALIFFLLLIVIPDVYLHRVWLRHYRCSWPRVAWWVVSVALLVYTLWLGFSPDFIPRNPWPLFIYLFVLGVFILPKAIFALVLAVAGALRSTRRRISGQPGSRHVTDNRRAALSMRSPRSAVAVASVLTVLIVCLVCYGVTAGFNKFEVRRIEFRSPQLPPAFDGYKVALFSDVHVGSYVTESGQKMLEQAMDSLNALGADLIVFAGDLQNARAEEIEQHRGAFSRLKAPDGVVAVLGNHDYAMYLDETPEERKADEAATGQQIRGLGWDLLLNEHRLLTRGNDTLVVAGTENLGRPPFPSKGDVAKTVQGVKPGSFILMVSHDPYAWRKAILPESEAQLTLSGHTHGGQVNLWGWSPYALLGREFDGFYYEGDRALFVTRGLGGLIPFRVGATGEIVLITLHRAQ